MAVQRGDHAVAGHDVHNQCDFHQNARFHAVQESASARLFPMKLIFLGTRIFFFLMPEDERRRRCGRGACIITLEILGVLSTLCAWGVYYSHGRPFGREPEGACDLLPETNYATFACSGSFDGEHNVRFLCGEADVFSHLNEACQPLIPGCVECALPHVDFAGSVGYMCHRVSETCNLGYSPTAMAYPHKQFPFANVSDCVIRQPAFASDYCATSLTDSRAAAWRAQMIAASVFLTFFFVALVIALLCYLSTDLVAMQRECCDGCECAADVLGWGLTGFLCHCCYFWRLRCACEA